MAKKKVEEAQVEEPKNEQIINTEAAKAKVEEVANNVKEGANNFVEKVKGDKYLLIACCVCAFVVFVILCSIIFCDGSKGAAKDMSKAIVKLNAKKYCKAINKDIILEKYDDMDECIDTMDEAWEEVDKEDAPKKYKIISDKKLKKDDVEEIAETLEEAYNIDENKVKKVVRYKVSFDAKGKDNDKDLYIFTAKIKGKWSVIGISSTKNYSMSLFG